MFKFLKPYSFLVVLITALSFGVNGLSLYFPKKTGEYVDLYKQNSFDAAHIMFVLIGLAFVVLILTFIQSGISTYAAQKIGLDLRKKIIGVLKDRSFMYMRETTSGHLITITTSDVDNVKNLISNGIPSILTALITLFGAIYFLFTINAKLALITLSVVPFIVIVFALVFKKMGPLFGAIQQNLDNINRTINESIIASALVRILSSDSSEMSKFDKVNLKGTELNKKLVNYFAALIPAITMLSQLAVLAVLWFGGVQVVKGSLTLGEMSAFFAYTSVLIFPFFILSFSGTIVSRAQVSLKRIEEVLSPTISSPVDVRESTEGSTNELKGHIKFKNVSLSYSSKNILKDISFDIQPRSRTAIIGPTGAGKTELLYLLSGLATATFGEIFIDDILVKNWDQSVLLSQLGMVFQDSIIFNTTFKENVMFNSKANDSAFESALKTADLESLVSKLPQGVETNVSERGTSLSGGQKQRLMLARALAISPRVLLLDDFTARVDAGTEARILSNIKEYYPDITLVSITQKIEPIKDYDQIIVLMEGELIAKGKHEDLLKTSLEYKQIYESQHSTE